VNSRQRLQAALNHPQPDRVCVDFGATFVTGIHVAIVDKLRKTVLGSLRRSGERSVAPILSPLSASRLRPYARPPQQSLAEI